MVVELVGCRLTSITRLFIEVNVFFVMFIINDICIGLLHIEHVVDALILIVNRVNELAHA